MRRTARRALVVGLWVPVLLAACTAPGGGTAASSTTTTVASTSTSTTAPSTTRPDGPFAPDPAAPVGPLPSFNESPGCGVAQGVRGPYASVVGHLEDAEVVRGPWGDFFGRDIGEIREQLVEVALPMTGEREVTVWVHEAVLPALERAIANLEREEAASNYYELRAGDVSSFNPTTVRPKRYLSFHAVGAAIDLNSSTNPYRGDNVLVTDMPEWFVKAWTDAGWCWGGDWQTIKDPMHFSWQGPLYTEGYPPPTPASARTSAGSFVRSIAFSTALGPAPDGAQHFLADLDRDGAPDVVRVHPWTAEGALGVEIAQAIYAFAANCTPLVTVPVTEGAALLFADADGDARPDLWEVDPSGERVAVTIHTHASGYSERLAPREMNVAGSGSLGFLAGDYDRDGVGDLFVVGRDTLGIWAGPGFEVVLAEAVLPAEVGEGGRFALGDYDLDGVLDLFAFGPGDPARLLVLSGAGGYVGPAAEVATGAGGHTGAFAVGDLDGDGRPDLYFVDPDGSLTVYLGGDRGDLPDEALTRWFVEGNDQPTTRQEACPVVP